MKTRTYAAALVAAGIMSVTVGAGVASATASGRAQTAVVGVASRGSLSATALPTSDITQTGSTLSFVPSSLNATWSGPTQHVCTAALAVMKIVNTTTATQTVVLAGTALPLQAGKGTHVCFWGSGTSSVTFHLKGDSKVRLKVNLS
jgi:hypothetical protein